MLSLKNISFGFRNQILNEITLQVEEKNQIIALLGPNGAGKTTLLNTIANLYQKYSGVIEGNESVFFLPDTPFIPENSTLSECLDDFNKLYQTFNKNRALEMLNFLKLDKKKKVSEYSKGMKEQLHLVFTLAQDVRLYLLDEPLAAVDPLTRDVLIHLIKNFRNTDSITIISTHLVQDMGQLFDEVIMLKDGQVKLYKAVNELVEKYQTLDLDTIYKEVNRDDNIG